MSQEQFDPLISTNRTDQFVDPLENLQNVYSNVSGKRDAIIDRLNDTISNINFQPDVDKPSVTEAKLRIYEVALAALAHKEKSAMDKVNVSFKQKEQTSNAAIGETVVELLKMIKPNSNTSPRNDGDVIVSDYQENIAQLDKVCTDAGFEIKEGELFKDSKDGID